MSLLDGLFLLLLFGNFRSALKSRARYRDALRTQLGSQNTVSGVLEWADSAKSACELKFHEARPRDCRQDVSLFANTFFLLCKMSEEQTQNAETRLPVSLARIQYKFLIGM